MNTEIAQRMANCHILRNSFKKLTMPTDITTGRAKQMLSNSSDGTDLYSLKYIYEISSVANLSNAKPS